MEFLKELNKEQKEVVIHKDGPILILAGPGSGKTKVITYRIAYLVQKYGIMPENILAITFTNKAAEEMKLRLMDMLGPETTAKMQISTFHSFAAKVLRRYCTILGYTHNFNIYDDKDQLRAIKNILKDMNLSLPGLTPAKISYFISVAKNNMVMPFNFADFYQYPNAKIVQRIYSDYQAALKENNAMDFDDLLLNLIELFEKSPETLQSYSTRFKYIHIDEYQDTNRVQYVLIKMLSEAHHNICVVGDENQSIYAFRGANIQNILDFEKDFPNAKSIKLEVNYRSTQTILDAATGLINNNTTSVGKTLKSNRNKNGQIDAPNLSKIHLYKAISPQQEAQFIVSEIVSLKRKYDYSGMCILYRTNAQSRVLEKFLSINRIPYKIFGTVKFYERKEVKDVIAYLKFLNNPRDNISLLRIINTPARGIGDVTIRKIIQYKNENSISLIEAFKEADQLDNLSAGVKTKVNNFLLLLNSLFTLRDTPLKLIKEFFKSVPILDSYKENDPERYQNVMELKNNLEEYFTNNPESDLNKYLEEIALTQTTDDFDFDRGYVSIMTLHNSKGLEFDAVFITGMEDGLLPHFNTLDSLTEIEEERRLLYVGLTRAKDLAYFTFTGERFLHGKYLNSKPSRFIKEIDSTLINNLNKTYSTQYASQSPSFDTGQIVEHKIWGIGEVISKTPERVVVEFPTVGRKNISLKYNVLRKI